MKQSIENRLATLTQFGERSRHDAVIARPFEITESAYARGGQLAAAFAFVSVRTSRRGSADTPATDD